MTDEPFQIKSLLPYTIIQFTTIIVLSLFAFTVGWELLGIAHADVLGWILATTLITIVTTLSLLSISWYMKQQVRVEEVEWNKKVQDVTLDEYTRMYKDYINSYSHLISRFDERDFILLILSLVTVYLVPYAMALSLLTVLFAPYVFGILVIGFGLSLSSFSFKFFGTTDFITKIPSPKKIHDFVRISQNVDGVAFAGIHLSIAEAGGYYNISAVRPIIRLEGIESAVRIDFVLDDSLRLKSLKSVFLISDDIIEQIIESTQEDERITTIRLLMIKTYKQYISLKGEDPFLTDLLQELEIDTE